MEKAKSVNPNQENTSYIADAQLLFLIAELGIAELGISVEIQELSRITQNLT